MEQDNTPLVIIKFMATIRSSATRWGVSIEPHAKYRQGSGRHVRRRWRFRDGVFYLYTKNEALTHCCFNVGAPSQTVAQQSNNIWSTCFVLTGLAVARIMGVSSSNLRIVECLSSWLCSNSAALQFTKRRNVIFSGDSPHDSPLSLSQSYFRSHRARQEAVRRRKKLKHWYK